MAVPSHRASAGPIDARSDAASPGPTAVTPPAIGRRGRSQSRGFQAHPMLRGAGAAGRAAAVAAPPTSQSSVWILLVLGVAVAIGVGLVLRLVDVGSHGFWSDEVEVIRRASLSMKAILTDTARRAPLDGPGSYLLTHLMMSVSTGEAWLRLQSVAWSIVAIVGIVALAMRLFGAARIAILAALLLAIAPFDIRYADELRYYTATSALQLWSLFFLVGWIR